MAQEHWTDRARRRMKSKGKTQESLKRVFGVTTRGAVGHYLRRRREPTIGQIKALAAVLECRLDWLVLGEGSADLNGNGDLAMPLTPDTQQLVASYQALPTAAQIQVQEFINMQLKLMEEHPEIFARTQPAKPKPRSRTH